MAIVLECVTEVKLHTSVMQLLAAFGNRAGMEFHHTGLELAEVWASKRQRWWGVFLPRELPPFKLEAWSPVPGFQKVGQVLPELLRWSEAISLDG